MTRRPNTRPTVIYWLYDMRPETIAIGWPVGYPFYCGKTVHSPEKRLKDHNKEARKTPNRHVCRWVNGCGEHVRIETVTVVPADGDWVAAEQHWIATHRGAYPVNANSNAGGAGNPGYIPTPEQREANRRLHKGRKRSPETRARIAAAVRGRRGHFMSDDLRAAHSARMKGNKIACRKHRTKSKLAAIRAENVRKRANSKQQMAQQRRVNVAQRKKKSEQELESANKN